MTSLFNLKYFEAAVFPASGFAYSVFELMSSNVVKTVIIPLIILDNLLFQGGFLGEIKTTISVIMLFFHLFHT